MKGFVTDPSRHELHNRLRRGWSRRPMRNGLFLKRLMHFQQLVCVCRLRMAASRPMSDARVTFFFAVSRHWPGDSRRFHASIWTTAIARGRLRSNDGETAKCNLHPARLCQRSRKAQGKHLVVVRDQHQGRADSCFEARGCPCRDRHAAEPPAAGRAAGAHVANTASASAIQLLPAASLISR
ncbi:hypothetical protein ACVWWD_005991 [Mesorhizobium sp. URHB0026]